jgi:hypothetical protein
VADRLLAVACVAAAVLAVVATVVLQSGAPLFGAGGVIAFAVALDLVHAGRRRRRWRRSSRRLSARANLLQARAEAARRRPEWPWPS